MLEHWTGLHRIQTWVDIVILTASSYEGGTSTRSNLEALGIPLGSKLTCNWLRCGWSWTVAIGSMLGNSLFLESTSSCLSLICWSPSHSQQHSRLHRFRYTKNHQQQKRIVANPTSAIRPTTLCKINSKKCGIIFFFWYVRHTYLSLYTNVMLERTVSSSVFQGCQGPCCYLLDTKHTCPFYLVGTFHFLISRVLQVLFQD